MLDVPILNDLQCMQNDSQLSNEVYRQYIPLSISREASKDGSSRYKEYYSASFPITFGLEVNRGKVLPPSFPHSVTLTLGLINPRTLTLPWGHQSADKLKGFPSTISIDEGNIRIRSSN